MRRGRLFIDYNMTEEKISYLYVALVVLLWASTAAVGKLMLKNLNNLQVLFYTSLIASISLFIIVLFQKKFLLIKKYKLKDYRHFAYMGFICVFLYYIFLFAGLMFAPAQEALIVNYTWPIWVVIFAMILLKEEFNLKKMLAILLGFIGVYVVVTKGDIFSLSIANIKGDLFAFAGAISYGIFSVLGKEHNYDKFTSMMFYYTFTFVFITISNLIFSEIPKISLCELAGLTWLGIFTSGLAFVFWFLALKHGDTAKMSNIVFLTPFLSLVFIYFLLGEKILFSSVIGLIL
ncbi:DMT family transporter, partial [Candidatus Woesearchaeota archaeon]|nr:DMT family transporter [Candidatus Woesearchaeota archaeon]